VEVDDHLRARRTLFGPGLEQSVGITSPGRGGRGSPASGTDRPSRRSGRTELPERYCSRIQRLTHRARLGRHPSAGSHASLLLLRLSAFERRRDLAIRRSWYRHAGIGDHLLPELGFSRHGGAGASLEPSLHLNRIRIPQVAIPRGRVRRNPLDATTTKDPRPAVDQRVVRDSRTGPVSSAAGLVLPIWPSVPSLARYDRRAPVETAWGRMVAVQAATARLWLSSAVVLLRGHRHGVTLCSTSTLITWPVIPLPRARGHPIRPSSRGSRTAP